MGYEFDWDEIDFCDNCGVDVPYFTLSSLTDGRRVCQSCLDEILENGTGEVVEELSFLEIIFKLIEELCFGRGL